MKDLKFICAQPVDKYFIWMVDTWLQSLKDLNLSEKAVILVFVPKNREKEVEDWQKLVSLYPESEFFFQNDEDDINRFLSIYIPVLRPYVLAKYFRKTPEANKFTYLYTDCDIIFTKLPDIDKYLNDGICYLSDTSSYIGAQYFDSKTKDVLPDKLENYKKRDILNETGHIVGINRSVAEKNQVNSGGAQYLLKEVTAEFWEKVFMDCIVIRKFLQNVNKQFFESENKGFQSWCADMWSVLWNLWYFNKETKVVPELNFAWSSDSIEKLKDVSILHNAGIASEKQGEIPVFYKGKYHQGNNPLNDPYLVTIKNHEKYGTLCNHIYMEKVIETLNKHK